MSAQGICLSAIAALRAEPSERSEMVSQLLFGETFEVLQNKGQWLEICSHADQYCGWVADKAVKLGEVILCRTVQVVTEPLAICSLSGKICYLPGGSFLSSDSPIESYGKTTISPFDGFVHKTVAFAGQYLGAPYLWGGKTLLGIDCSGLVQIAFRMAGEWLPRDSSEQSKLGEKVTGNIQSGDLAFFEDETHRIVHVGIVCDNHRIIHASGYVRVDLLDSKGIYRDDLKRYTHRLAFVKRL